MWIWLNRLGKLQSKVQLPSKKAVKMCKNPQKKKISKKRGKMLAFELIMLIFVLNYNKKDDIIADSKLIKSI